MTLKLKPHEHDATARAPRRRQATKIPPEQQALLRLNAHHVRLCSGRSLPKVLDAPALRELNVTLAFWSVPHLLELSVDLTEQPYPGRALTAEDAVMACLQAIEKTTGLVFPRPVVTAVRPWPLPEKPRKKSRS